MKLKFLAPLMLIILIISSCKQNNNAEKYAHLPEELAQLFIQIDKDPTNPDLYEQRATYYIKQRNVDSAYFDAYAALRYDSLNPDRYIFLADLFFMQGLFENSEEILERAHVKAPKNIDVMTKLAEIHLFYKRYTEMNDFLNKALEMDNRNPQAYFMKGFALKEQGDTLNAIRNFNKAVDQNPTYFDAYIQLGLMYHARLNPLALDYYNNALNINPQSIQANYNIAIFYQETKNVAKAKERYHIILQIDPENAWAHHNLGWIAMELEKNNEKAVEHFTNALNIEPYFLEASYNRGAAYEKMGQRQLAIDNYNHVLKIDPNYDMALERLYKLGIRK
jgi:tetratricopeptide (TPR) repeat protein